MEKNVQLMSSCRTKVEHFAITVTNELFAPFLFFIVLHKKHFR